MVMFFLPLSEWKEVSEGEMAISGPSVAREFREIVAGGGGETEKWTKLILQPLAKVGCESNLGHPEGGQ